jgi:hypothetical protein
LTGLNPGSPGPGVIRLYLSLSIALPTRQFLSILNTNLFPPGPRLDKSACFLNGCRGPPVAPTIELDPLPPNAADLIFPAASQIGDMGSSLAQAPLPLYFTQAPGCDVQVPNKSPFKSPSKSPLPILEAAEASNLTHNPLAEFL